MHCDFKFVIMANSVWYDQRTPIRQCILAAKNVSQTFWVVILLTTTLIVLICSSLHYTWPAGAALPRGGDAYWFLVIITVYQWIFVLAMEQPIKFSPIVQNNLSEMPTSDNVMWVLTELWSLVTLNDHFAKLPL